MQGIGGFSEDPLPLWLKEGPKEGGIAICELPLGNKQAGLRSPQTREGEEGAITEDPFLLPLPRLYWR